MRTRSPCSRVDVIQCRTSAVAHGRHRVSVAANAQRRRQLSGIMSRITIEDTEVASASCELSVCETVQSIDELQRCSSTTSPLS